MKRRPARPAFLISGSRPWRDRAHQVADQREDRQFLPHAGDALAMQDFYPHRLFEVSQVGFDPPARAVQFRQRMIHFFGADGPFQGGGGPLGERRPVLRMFQVRGRGWLVCHNHLVHKELQVVAGVRCFMLAAVAFLSD